MGTFPSIFFISPISASLSLSPKEYSLYSLNSSRVIPFPLPPSVSIVAYEHNPKNPYPVNLLRNLAIRNVKTSHFFYNDIDFIPSRTLSSSSLFRQLIRRTNENSRITTSSSLYSYHRSRF